MQIILYIIIVGTEKLDYDNFKELLKIYFNIVDKIKLNVLYKHISLLIRKHTAISIYLLQNNNNR